MLVVEALIPVFVQVGLVFVLIMVLMRRRMGAFRRGEVKMKDVALDEPNFPPAAIQAANCFKNQFELPVLFYALVAFALITRKADLLFVIMSWLFVISRLAHAYIHVGRNDLRQRGPVHGLGAAVLFLMWLIFAVRIIAGI